MKTIALVLLAINVIAYALLWLLLLLRLLFFFSRVKADINDHLRGPGFFTVVAGTRVLGSELLIVVDQYRIAVGLWFVGLLLCSALLHLSRACWVAGRFGRPSCKINFQKTVGPLARFGNFI